MNTWIRSALLPLSLLLAACVTGPQPHLAAPVKDVPTADQAQYWVIDHNSIPPNIPAENACFRIKAIIDSDGKLYQPQVLALVGPGVATWVPTFLHQLRFNPAVGNTARVPIRTVLVWTLTQTVSTMTVSAASAQAAIKAVMAAGPSPESLDWNRSCKAQMDAQMGISAAPAAATSTLKP
jgi:hypothetical protein